MSPRNKKRYLKKKHNRGRKNVEDTQQKQEPVEPPGRSECEIDSEKSSHQKRKFLDIIEKITNLLKLDNDNRLLKLLEQIIGVADQGSGTENLPFQLVRMFFMHILECDKEEIYALKVSMSSKLLPDELKKLTVDIDDLILGSFFPLATGCFGVLTEGFLRKSDGTRAHVVIKYSSDHESDQHILSEAKVMAQFDHDNLRKILAFHKGPAGVRFAMEFMNLGVLEDALQEYNFSDKKLLLMVKEVAAGMQYIAQKKYVHRDLRCAKVFLDSQGKCKIGGFRRCRYVGDTGGACENEGMHAGDLYAAPEVRQTNKFTTEADMWAMGLLAWETFFMARCTLRANPFLPREMLKLFTLELFESRGVLPNPGRCSPFLWMYIKDEVLNKNPKVRPTFAELTKKLDLYDCLL